jgi:PilZ domain
MDIQVVLPQPGQAAQRRWPRHKVEVPVELVTQGPLKVAIVQGHGSALNCGGMAVSGGVDLPIGAQLAVEFTPPGASQPITVRCFVRNRQRSTYGVEFITESDADYENVGQIEAILRNMESRVR